MKRVIILVLYCVAINIVAKGQDKILIAGSGWNKVGLVDVKSANLEWEFDLLSGEDCNDIELTSKGEILLACKTSAVLTKWDKSVVWRYQCQEDEEINTATELKGKLKGEFGGKYLLAICANPSRFVVLNEKGEKVKEVAFESGVSNVHGQFRQVLPIKGGKYLLPLMGKGEVLEIGSNGEVLKRVKVGGNPFSVKVVKNGYWAVACGDGHNVVFVDPLSEKVVESIDENTIEGAKLLFVSEFKSYKDGSMIMSNWNGHANDKNQPKLFKIDSNQKMIWSLPMSDKIVNISAFYPMK